MARGTKPLTYICNGIRSRNRVCMRGLGIRETKRVYSTVLLIYTLTQLCKKVLFMCDAKLQDVPGRSRVKVHLCKGRHTTINSASASALAFQKCYPLGKAAYS